MTGHGDSHLTLLLCQAHEHKSHRSFSFWNGWQHSGKNNHFSTKCAQVQWHFTNMKTEISTSPLSSGLLISWIFVPGWNCKEKEPAYCSVASNISIIFLVVYVHPMIESSSLYLPHYSRHRPIRLSVIKSETNRCFLLLNHHAATVSWKNNAAQISIHTV